MTSRTRVNGVEHTDSVTIYCSSAEPLLNYDAIRQKMMSVLDSSGYPAAVSVERVERVFLIVQDTVTPGSTPYVFIKPALPGANECSTGDLPSNLLRDRPPNTKVLAWGHDHVIGIGPTEIGLCPDPVTGELTYDKDGKLLGITYKAGPSVKDGLRFFDRDQPTHPDYVGPVPHFVFDFQQINIMRPGQIFIDAFSFSNTKRWGFGRCKWPKRVVT